MCIVDDQSFSLGRKQIVSTVFSHAIFVWISSRGEHIVSTVVSHDINIRSLPGGFVGTVVIHERCVFSRGKQIVSTVRCHGIISCSLWGGSSSFIIGVGNQIVCSVVHHDIRKLWVVLLACAANYIDSSNVS